MTATQTVNGPWNSKDLQQEKYTKDKKIVSTEAGPPDQIWKVEISPYLLLKCTSSLFQSREGEGGTLWLPHSGFYYRNGTLRKWRKKS